ncbi:hypothetical protein ACFL40_04470 [candidate division KSB1 bacterium]
MKDDIIKLRTKIKELQTEIKHIKESQKLSAEIVENVLRRRGLNFYQSCPDEQLLIPRLEDAKIEDTYYQYFKKYSFRLLLRDIIIQKEKIKNETLMQFCSIQTVRKYLAFLEKAEIIEKTEENNFQLKKNINTFGETLEWFIAQVFRKEFYSPADWRIKIYNTESGGDFDVIAVLNGLLVFVEVKSSPPKHIHQSTVSEFFTRIRDITPDISIFLVDTHLRLKDKINVMFEYELKKSKIPYEIKNIFAKIFCVNNSVFIVNSKPDIVTNIKECIKYYFSAREK